MMICNFSIVCKRGLIHSPAWKWTSQSSSIHCILIMCYPVLVNVCWNFRSEKLLGKQVKRKNRWFKKNAVESKRCFKFSIFYCLSTFAISRQPLLPQTRTSGPVVKRVRLLGGESLLTFIELKLKGSRSIHKTVSNPLVLLPVGQTMGWWVFYS